MANLKLRSAPYAQWRVRNEISETEIESPKVRNGAKTDWFG